RKSPRTRSGTSPGFAGNSWSSRPAKAVRNRHTPRSTSIARSTSRCMASCGPRKSPSLARPPQPADRHPRTDPLPDRDAARSPRVTDYLEYAVFRIAFALFAAVPRRAALRIGTWIGELFFRLDRPHRHIALYNLRLAFPDRSES